MVTAPMDGFIEHVKVQANQPVKKGDVLFQMEQSIIRHQLEVSKNGLAVAKAELLKARRLAFSDMEMKASLPLLKAKVEQQTDQLHYSKSLMERSIVRSSLDGVAIF